MRPALGYKFHYAIQVAELVSDLSQTGSSYLDMSRYLEPGRRPVEAIFHYAILLASRSATRAGRRPACELVASWIA